MDSRPVRMANLDGLRAVSIAWVVALHLHETGHLIHAWPIRIASRGVFGVHIFFTLSGYLITRLLLLEEQRTGSISLKGFYTRRAFRILPPVLTYLAVMALFVAFGLFHAEPVEFATCMLFVHNYFPKSNELAHFWSLSVEEQFYAVFPLSLLLIRSPRLRLAGLLGLACAWPIWRFLSTPDQPSSLDWRTDICGGWIVVGCLLAVLQQRSDVGPWLRRRWLQSDITLLLACAGVAWTMQDGPPCSVSTLWGLRAALLFVILNYLSEDRRRWGDRLFSSRPMVLLGTWSFSLYVWQQIFIKSSGHWYDRAPACLVLALLAAALSYYGVERPALAARQRWFSGKSRSPGR